MNGVHHLQIQPPTYFPSSAHIPNPSHTQTQNWERDSGGSDQKMLQRLSGICRGPCGCAVDEKSTPTMDCLCHLGHLILYKIGFNQVKKPIA